MTTAEPLGRIERLDPREVWAKEDRDFTPWLANHIEELGDALGLELELSSSEAPVGDFSLDILARDIGRDRPVIIENQLEETNHRHLGQLLTYAAGYNAGVVVWVAKDFRDEHRAALDLLNRHTDDEIEFFGVVVEVWRIAESPRAPNLKVVVAPNEWGRRVKQTADNRRDGETSERAARYRTFYQSLFDTLRERHVFPKRREAGRSGHAFASSTRSGQYYIHFERQRKVSVGVWIDGADKDTNHDRFATLEQYRDEIATQLGELSWERREGLLAPRIAAYRDGSIDDDENTLTDIREWMLERLLALKEEFNPRLQELN